MFDKMNKILMYFAHPDDETLACGGTIAKMSELGKQVHVAISNTGIYALSNVNSNVNKDGQLDKELLELRENCINALAILGVDSKNIYFGDFPDNASDTRALLSLIQWIEPIIDNVKPDAVFSHHRFCANIDHQYCHESAVIALRPAEIFMFPCFAAKFQAALDI